MKEIKVGDILRVRKTNHLPDTYPCTNDAVVRVTSIGPEEAEYRYKCKLLFGEWTISSASRQWDYFHTLEIVEIINEQENHRELPDDSDRVE